MSKSFDEMSKKELQTAAEFYKVTDKVIALSKEKAEADGKATPKVPTNETYIEVLEGLKSERAKDPEVIAEVDDNEEEPTKVGNAHSSAGKSYAEMTRDFLHTKVPVIITDHDSSTSTEEEIEGKIVNISWGNKRGKETARIALNTSDIQYVKEGALRAMRDVMIPVNLRDKTTRNKRRFGIEITQGWSKEELDRRKKEQALKEKV